jgi:cytochrome c biogenesis protein CcdA
VVTAAAGFGGARAATIDVAVAGSVVAGAKPARRAARAQSCTARSADGDAVTIAIAIVSALVGGLILNLMPCVFPVLALKVLGFATHKDSRATMRHEAAAFAGGVMLTFVALGAALAALRAGGEQLGWGFQLQSPAVVSALAILFFVLALNLSGVFEFGQLAPSGVTDWTSKNRTLDAFASGILAVVIASPCTAPFMGAALGLRADRIRGDDAADLRRRSASAWPCPTSCWRGSPAGDGGFLAPALARALQADAGVSVVWTVIWLAWVLGAQRDNDALLRLLIVLLGIGFTLWTWRIVRTGARGPGPFAGLVASRIFGGHRVAVVRGGDACRRRTRRSVALPVSIRDWAASRRTRIGAYRLGPARVRRLHRRVVRHVPGQQEARAQFGRRAHAVRGEEGRARACRLDAARSRHHAGARRAGAERRPGVRAVSAREGAVAAARGAAAQHDARRARHL